MNSETKIAIGILVLLACGLALIFAGLWPVHKLAAVGVGIAVTCASLSLFATVWKGRR